MSILTQLRSILGKAESETPTPLEPAKDRARTIERRRQKRLDSHKGRRILIIDDSSTITAALKKILRSAGCMVTDAQDAETGLEKIRCEKPDLVFLDIILPGMNGFAALRLMRRDPLSKHIPVIMISGNEQATEQFYAKRIGADDFMKKPFSRHEVFARMEGLVESNKLAYIKAIAEKPSATPRPSPQSPQTPALPARPPQSSPSSTSSVPKISALEARTQLTAMGLQYFNQEQFIAAIERGDKLAVELFVASGSIRIPA